MRTLLKAVAVMALACGVQAEEISVLFVGADHDSEIPTNLIQMVSSDASITDTVRAEFFYTSDTINSYYESREVPSDSNTFLNKLNEGFDYIFVFPEEEYLYRFPGLYLEEVRLIQEYTADLGSEAVVPMIWGSDFGAIDDSEYEEHSYRIGDALSLTTLPVGLAWADVVSDLGSVSNCSPQSALTEEASYLMAVSAYTHIFGNSPTNSTYTPAGVSVAEKTSILGHSYSNWVSAATDTHYTGAYTNGFCSPLQIPFDVNDTACVFMGTSTETAYGRKYSEVMADGGYSPNRTHIGSAYYSTPNRTEVIDTLGGKWFDFVCARFTPNWDSQSYPTVNNYQDLKSHSQNKDLPIIGFFYQGRDIPDTVQKISLKALSNAKHCADRNAVMGHGTVFSVPAQIAAGRLWNRSENLLEFSGVHVSEHMETVVAAMLFTMLTGSNCADFASPHPQTSGPHQEAYEWVQNVGYRTIKQLGSLEAVPAAEANTRPAAVIGSDTADHVAADVNGGGEIYYVDHELDGVEDVSLHGSDSYDTDGSITNCIWSQLGSEVEVGSHFATNNISDGTTFELRVVDNLSETSTVSEAIIRLIDPKYILHDDLESVTGGYGWKDNSWAINNTYQHDDYVQWGMYNGFQCMNLKKQGKATRTINLSAYNGDLVLEYAWKAVSLEAGETGKVEVYDGAWHTIKTITDEMDDGAWHLETLGLSEFEMVSNFKIRFSVAGSAKNDELSIDAIRISTYKLPRAEGMQFGALEGSSRAFTLASSGGEAALSYTLTQPANGTLSGTEPNLTYTPDPGFSGTDSFTYSVTDGTMTSKTATVKIVVIPESSMLGPNASLIGFMDDVRLDGLSNFPVLVKLDPDSMPGFDYDQFSSANGGDLRFTDATGTQELNFEISSWDTNGVSQVWVQVPEMQSGGVIWVCWGSPTETNLPAYASNGATWDENYIGVWHLDETSGKDIYDSTANENHGYKKAAAEPAVTSGAVGGAQHWDGANDWIDIPDDPTLDVTNQFTISFFAQHDTGESATNHRLISRKHNGGDSDGWMVYPKNSKDIALVSSNNDTTKKVKDVVTSWSGDWNYITVIYKNTTGYAYRNGQYIGSTTLSVPFVDNDQPLTFGSEADHQTGEWQGKMDEIRYSSSVRSANWIWAEYATMVEESFTRFDSVITGGPIISVYGNGNLIADGDTTPAVGDGTTFGNIPVGAEKVNVFTITNVGPATLILTNASEFVVVSGAPDFSVASQPSASNIAPAGHVTFQLAFAPVAHSTAVTSTVSIANNDGDQAPYTFTVSGQSPAEFATNSTPTLWLYNQGLAGGGYNTAAMSDTDLDGMLAWEEYFAGTDPTNRASVFAVSPVIQGGRWGLEIPASSKPGTPVSIYRSTNLVNGGWQFVTNYLRTNAIGTDIWIDEGASNSLPRIYYKISVPTD